MNVSVVYELDKFKKCRLKIVKKVRKFKKSGN